MRPITRSGRALLGACLLLVTVVLGFAASIALYQVHRETARSSAFLGMLLCGPGQRVDDVAAGRRARRMICRDGQGREVGGRVNLAVIYMALPFVLAFAAPALWFVARADLREGRGPRS